MRLEGLHRRVVVPGSAMPAGEYVYSKPPPIPSGRYRSGPRTLDQFGTPHGDFMPDVAEFDRMFHAVEMTLVPQVPKGVRMHIQTARNLGVYAGFSYDLSAVSAYWSITCIEMALWKSISGD